MNSMLVKVVVGVVLFGASLAAGLLLTGRWNHEGAANIPLVGALFAEELPPAAATAPLRRAGAAATRSRGTAQGEASADERTARGNLGRSAPGPQQPAASSAAVAERRAGQESAPDAADDAVAGYSPGALFRFEGLPAGLTPEQINDAWRRVQEALADVESRRNALSLRERELEELADDVARRQSELGVERTRIEQLHRDLDARIQEFQEQIKLVRTDEVATLKRNAQTLASFEEGKAAELIAEQWRTERGQDEVLKTLEFMEKNRLNEILAALPNATVQDLLRKRLRVVVEAAPSAPPR